MRSCNYESMLSNLLTCSRRVIWMMSRGGKTHVACWIPAMASERSCCAVHYNMCASHPGGTLTVISIAAEAVFPGSTSHLDGSWRKQVPAQALLPASGVHVESDRCAVSVTGPQKGPVYQNTGQLKGLVAGGGRGTNIPTSFHTEEPFSD